MNIAEKQTLKIVLQVSFVLALVAVAFWLSLVISRSDAVSTAISQFGYFGVFIVALISGFNLAVPIPASAFLPVFISAGFSAVGVVTVITLGMTMADALGFLIGRTGRDINIGKTQERVLSALDRFRKRHRSLAYFFLLLYSAFAPIPNELLVIPMAFAGFKFKYIIPIVFLGNLIFNTTLALGILGILTFL